MTLKHQTVSGLSWSFIENISTNGIAFIFGIIMARLLTPAEFGLFGMTLVFIAFFEPFVSSGLPSALIRKTDCTQADLSTVFYYNLAISIAVYIILFIFAGAISVFFNEPQIKPIIRLSGLILILRSLSIVQRTMLMKKINFKLLAKISILSSVVSGITAIYLAYHGFGVWSLVTKQLLIAFISMLLLFYWNRWMPSFVFCVESFKQMFSFGWKLLVSGFLNTVQRNVVSIVIGKFYAASDLGFYTRAERFKNLLSQNITIVVQKVTYPALSSIQDNTLRLKTAYRKLIKSIMLITLVPLVSLAAISRTLTITLIGDQWLPSVPYLRLLCFVGIFVPLIAVNSNMLLVQGRSDIVLKINLASKLLLVPVVLSGILFSIDVMIIGMIVHSIAIFFIYSHWSGKFISYTSFDQLSDIFPSFLLSVTVGILVFSFDLLLTTPPLITLVTQCVVFTVATLGLTELFGMKDYLYIKDVFMEKVFHVFSKTK